MSGRTSFTKSLKHHWWNTSGLSGGGGVKDLMLEKGMKHWFKEGEWILVFYPCLIKASVIDPWAQHAIFLVNPKKKKQPQPTCICQILINILLHGLPLSLGQVVKLDRWEGGRLHGESQSGSCMVCRMAKREHAAYLRLWLSLGNTPKQGKDVLEWRQNWS